MSDKPGESSSEAAPVIPVSPSRSPIQSTSGYSNNVNVSPANLRVVDSPTTPVSRPRLAATSPSIHLNSNWLHELKADLKGQVFDKCSARVQEAVEANEYIEVLDGD